MTEVLMVNMILSLKLYLMKTENPKKNIENAVLLMYHDI